MRCAVLGSPIEHSLSPVLHRAAYRELGLDWSYDAVEVEEAGFARFLDGLDADWRGLSLTMPLKRTVIDLLDQTEELVRVTGIANTIVIDAGRRIGYNTDIPGSARAIRERTQENVDSAIILGGGATAASLGWALADLGCTDLQILVRNPATVTETVEVIHHHPRAPRVSLRTFARMKEVRPATIAASTVPAAAQTDAVLAMLEASGAMAVFDAIYDPWPTPLTTWAAETGRVVISGLDLLTHQAALQVELMSGRRPSVDTMREAGFAVLAERAR